MITTPFISDGGLETWMLFHEEIELRDFAAFEMVLNEPGRETLKTYYRRYARIARKAGQGFLFESATWRASADWGERLGYSPERLADANRRAMRLLAGLRAEFQGLPTILSGCVGPRGDGYAPTETMRPSEAARYHRPQIEALKAGGAEVISAITMTHVGEAAGIAHAAQDMGLPVVLSFTVETNGCLPDGTDLGHAIELTDRATDNAAAYYMVNCAHPSHFEHAFATGAKWLERIGGIKANASRMSHAELDCAEELDDGNPAELGCDYHRLRGLLPNLRIVSGCCGTDHRHIAAMSEIFAEPLAA
ncbi:MAG: homocysteine S-methyltransferase family protein [Pseudomonadota bacterium]